MKKYFYFILSIAVFSGMCSCEKEFLQKPSTTGTTTIQTVFSTTVNANNAIAAAYRASLIQGLPYSGLDHGTMNSLAGELSWGYNWHETYKIVTNGENATSLMEDNYDANYSAIRQDYLVYENIGNVSDMDASTKSEVKGEMLGLIAYRYMGMFIRYGGVPIVTKSLSPSDNLKIPRASLQQTEDTIISLCNQAAALLPNSWPSQWKGRLTKGAALAIKARTLMFAARPLFNSSTPYISLGDRDSLICFMSNEPQRWQDAITACQAVIKWANANGYEIINTGGGGNTPDKNAFVDYATATSTPDNPEVLLAYKWDDPQYDWSYTVGYAKYFNISTYWNALGGDGYDMDNYGMETNFLSYYYTAQGTNQTWPGIGNSNALPATDYFQKMSNMEPRFLADNMPHSVNPLNNPGDQGWAAVNADRGVNQNGSAGKGDCVSVKYYYQAGSRVWFEFPLFRMPEFYLDLAEAYNEVGNIAQSLENLNIVHNRAGLPSITATNQDSLRKAIHREWRIEFYNENQGYFLVKHWKDPNIGNGEIGGPRREFQFTTNGGNPELPADLLTYYDQVVFNAYWSPKMFLDPFPQSEVNKGTIIQNPGY
ncbi:MAG: RagB/SusD family nutrient uptake outer membrane protein [Chitinophagaceae bacterium]|nr:MAG: RagB/SusD family nutrient uptake outer membrane protein [Chitinophagaceae bacterium]